MLEDLAPLFDGLARDPELGFFTLFLGGLFLLGGYRFLKLQARRRLMEDTPTSRIRSASQGYVELEGQARLMQGTPILSPLTQTECAWYRFKVEKREQDSDHHTRWVTVRDGVSGELFLLDDGTGECVVDPDHAVVEPVSKRVWYGPFSHPALLQHGAVVGRRDYRFTEELIQPGEHVYALGWFTSYDPLHVSLHERTRDTIIAWKNDPHHRRRYDTDGNGHLDANEFTVLREEARRRAEADHRQQAGAAQTHLLRADSNGRPFLLSTHDQHKLAARLRIHAWLWLAAALAGLGLFIHLITHVLPIPVS
ncbi:MAG: GIDE domain-containing protein [Pseudomonadota bacterium]